MLLMQTASGVRLTAETWTRLADGGEPPPKQTALLAAQLEACKPLSFVVARWEHKQRCYLPGFNDVISGKNWWWPALNEPTAAPMSSSSFLCVGLCVFFFCCRKIFSWSTSGYLGSQRGWICEGLVCEMNSGNLALETGLCAPWYVHFILDYRLLVCVSAAVMFAWLTQWM